MHPMRVGVIIPAAGRSSRFGAQDKLAQDLGGRPVLLRTVELFTKRDDVFAIIVAGPADDIDAFKERYGPALSFHGAKVVAGGSIDRWESVRNALALMPDDLTHIAVHDAARPCTSPELIARVFEGAKVAKAVIPGVSVTSTLKRVSESTVATAEDDAVASAILGDFGMQETRGRIVTETISRDQLVLVQTPQIFEAQLLRRAYAAGNLEGTTDDASVIERFGETVVVVEGDPRNLKITTADDLALARAIMGIKSTARVADSYRFE
ncbi:MAG: 2-C-methyl-D-erythritol 4-phosphate cytidylyltransferase [Phycisphaerales bacterium]|nr:2-C-methyl-D-erythritol 4-phosphate cytidylyltransferase [Phycisphaerales bacterium]